MARLQILELPEGSGDDRPPFMLILDEISDDDAERIINSQDSINAVAKAAGARAVAVFHGLTINLPANDTTAYLAEAAKPEEGSDALAEARTWARHGYEIGQRHCGWTDHRVAPDWLTEGWPTHFDSCEHLKRAAELEEVEAIRKRVANECKAALLDALGMDRTRDWDDIRNAARGLRQECDAKAVEIERLRAGEEPVTDEGVAPNPGQWIWHWNRATPEKRLSMAAQIQDGMARSNNCFMADHEAQIEQLSAELERHRTKNRDA